MLFNKNDEKPNDRIIYQTKPNLILGCKKAIYGVIILVIILMVSPFIIRFIGEMQVYMISHIKLSLTRYAAINKKELYALRNNSGHQYFTRHFSQNI